jgi:hypothetical protein
MIFGGLSLLVGVILLPLGQVLAFFSWGLAAYSIRVVEFFARLPWASQTLAVFPLAMVMTLYGLLAVLTLRPLREKLKQIKPRPAIVFGILAALCLWFWSAALAAPDRTLQLIMLDVGGEAILIRTPAGRSLLVNAGPSLTRLTDELRRELAFGQELDWLLLAGSQREQIGALITGLDRVSPQTLAFAAGGEQVEVVRQQAASAGIATTELRAGDILDLGSKSSLKVLSLSSSGAVLLIEWEEFSALLPVGLDRDLIEGSDLSLPPVDLLLLADGGNPALSPPEWLAALSPQIIWVASEDELDAPTQFLVQDFRVLPSHHYGWLKMTTDGHDIWLSSQ